MVQEWTVMSELQSKMNNFVFWRKLVNMITMLMLEIRNIFPTFEIDMLTVKDFLGAMFMLIKLGVICQTW